MERKVKAKRLSVIVGLAFAAIVSAFIALVGFTAERSYAAKDFDYYVVVDSSGNFAGVNLTDSTGGALTFAGDGRTEKTDYDVMITYEIDNLEKSSTNGILIRIDRSMATADLNPRMLLETSDGILYRLFYNANDSFINIDGTSLDTSEWKSSTTFSTPKQMNGTFFIPWGSINASGTLMPDSEATAPAAGSAVPNGTVFTRFHFIVQTRTASQLQVTRSTAIGAIATVRRNTEDLSASVVTSLLDVGSLSYTVDSSATADVNLGDMKNGSTVYSKYTTDGSFNVSQDENTLSAMTFTRNAAEITVECKDDSGNSVGNNLTVRAAYDKTNGNFPFDISGIIPEINGYTFDSELSDSLSGVINGNTKITLVYRPLTRIKSVSAVLQDRIAMRFNVVIADEVKETATVSINEITDMKAADGTDNGDGSYCFVYKINAAEMTKNINIKVENGTETSEEKNYSFREYADKLLNAETSSDSLKSLIKATLNYGACAQVYFGVNAEELANSVLEESEKTVETDSIENAVKSKTGELPPEVEEVRFSLSCKDSIVFNFYLLVTADSDLSAVTLKIDGQDFNPEEAGNGWYCKSTELAPAELSDEITFTVGESLITVNAYAYFETCLNSTDGNLVNLVKSMYIYAEYAKAYFNLG